jgi:hypothetical protein
MFPQNANNFGERKNPGQTGESPIFCSSKK